MSLTPEYQYLFINQLLHPSFLKNTKNNILYIICYFVNQDTIFPFLNFMVEKHHNTLLNTDSYQLPLLFLDSYDNLEQELQNKLKLCLNISPYDNLNYSIKGIYQFTSNNFNNNYIFINIDKPQTNKYTHINTSFCITTELINNGSLNFIPFDNHIKKLFKNNLHIGKLHDTHNNPYICPDVVYKFTPLSKKHFINFFEFEKTKEHYMFGYFYWFSTSLNNHMFDAQNDIIHRYAFFSYNTQYVFDFDSINQSIDNFDSVVCCCDLNYQKNTKYKYNVICKYEHSFCLL